MDRGHTSVSSYASVSSDKPLVSRWTHRERETETVDKARLGARLGGRLVARQWRGVYPGVGSATFEGSDPAAWREISGGCGRSK